MTRRRRALGAAGRLGAGLLWAALLGVLVWQLVRNLVGEPSARLEERWHESHELCDRHGTPLRQLPSSGGVRGRSLALEEVGDRLVVSTIVSEDRRFYAHSGIDKAAVLRAVGQNARHVRLVSGASTITQQLVKLLDGAGQPGPRTLGVKVRESARAENLEQVLSKRQILEAYLNRLNYGRGLVGPAVAAQSYFGVSPRQLSWAQAAFLAVLPRAPSYLDPFRHPDRVRRRQQLLIDALHEHGVLSDDAWQRARAEPVEPRPLDHPFQAPHLVEALRTEGGLADGSTTHTTLDLPLQRDVEGLVRSRLARLADRNAETAAVMVVDNPSGEVLAYVGSGGFDNPRILGQIDMIRALRQPGSTLKPFIYALAIERGLSPAEVVADVPTRFGEQSHAYQPGNFDGTFRGPLSAREALAGSLNVPAVRLAAELPRGALLELLRRAGMQSLHPDPDRYGLSLALGSGELRLRELAQGYVALARGGKGVSLRYTADDPATLGDPQDGRAVIDPAAAALVTEALSDPLARVRGLGGRGPFDLGFPVAVKTGTSSGYRDSWTAGYTQERTVVVWVGNADGRPTAELTGGSGAGPLFAEVMQRAMQDLPSRAPLWDTELLERRPVCPLSGLPVGPACPEAVRRYGPRRDRRSEAGEPAQRCELHQHAHPRPAATKGDPPWRCDPSGSHRIVVLPAEFDDWLARQPVGAPGRDPAGVPWYPRSAVQGCRHRPAGPSVLHVDEPTAGTVLVLAPDSQMIELRASTDHGSPIDEVQFLLDGEVVARSAAPFRAAVAVGRGDHVLRVRPADPHLGALLATSRFSVR